MPSFSQTSMLSLQSAIDESILNNSQSNIKFTSGFLMTTGGTAVVSVFGAQVVTLS
jgi:hypothetical protein